jgi:spore coat polysaccharide biosynthesis protein SpsF
MNGVVVLQARTSSARLPGKVMLPVKGIPIVVLAAQRASNTGRHVIVVTSNDPSDDGLVALLEAHNLDYFRGDLKNVLNRTVHALSQYQDDTVVVRLTADNVLPDGYLIDQMENEFLDKDYQYLSSHGEESGLPYGVSVEVTRLAYLREAVVMTTDPADQEHVTLYIKRKYGVKIFKKYKALKKSRYRCTVDCLEDYLSIQSIFLDLVDPVQEPMLHLVDSLQGLPLQPITDRSMSRFILGTAQLGNSYGIANSSGKPTPEQSIELIRAAISNGVTYLDTARAYGDSEEVIGSSLMGGWFGRVGVITKLDPLQSISIDSSDAEIRALVDASIYKSCALLGVKRLDILMVHRASHLSDNGGEIWRRLIELKNSGVIGELGVSAQNPNEILFALNCSDVTHIQMPFNLLDWRWDVVIPKIFEIKKMRALNIYIRSTLLQGLLTSENSLHWASANCSDGRVIIDWLEDQVRNYDREDVVDLCLSFVNALEWVDGIVLGIENMTQLKANIHYFNQPPLNLSEVKAIEKSRPRLAESTLNPSFWERIE